MASRGRRKGRLSILDMSVEDDSLLPGNSNITSILGLVEEEEDPQQEQVTRAPPPPPVPQESAAPLVESCSQAAESRPLRRSKTSAHSLRKSLAWDKAFLTGEGVLDADELPISTRSPKKLPELPTLEVNVKPAENYVPAVDRWKNGSSTLNNSRSFSERFDSRSAKTGFSSIPEERIPQLSNPGPSVPTRRPSSSLSGAIVPRPPPAKKVIESAIQKGTRLRLPSTFSAPDKKNVPHPVKQQKEASLTKRVTSVSRKVKDTLDKVLPGRIGSLTAERPVNRVPTPSANAGMEAGLETGAVFDSVDEKATDSGGVHMGDYGPMRSSSAGSRPKTNLSISTDDLRSKPTGLRMPSPKLGFFEAGKSVHASQSLKSVAASTGPARVPVSTNFQGSRTKPHGLPKIKTSERVPSAIPSAPHLRTAEKDYITSCTSAPSTPRRMTNDLLSPSARFAASNSLTPKAKSKENNKTSRRLGMESMAMKGTNNDDSELSGTTDASKENFERPALKITKLDLGREAADENGLAVWKDWPVLAATRSEADGCVKSPLAVNCGLLNAGPKEKCSLFALAKKAVGRLSSPLQERAPDQENQASKLTSVDSTFSPGEATLEDAKIVKTGPVQHSPPNKPVLQPGPWSPVRKHGPQLGPFDCTKSNVHTVGWEAS